MKCDEIKLCCVIKMQRLIKLQSEHVVVQFSKYFDVATNMDQREYNIRD
jgi:hypothetical protein